MRRRKPAGVPDPKFEQQLQGGLDSLRLELSGVAAKHLDLLHNELLTELRAEMQQMVRAELARQPVQERSEHASRDPSGSWRFGSWRLGLYLVTVTAALVVGLIVRRWFSPTANHAAQVTETAERTGRTPDPPEQAAAVTSSAEDAAISHLILSEGKWSDLFATGGVTEYLIAIKPETSGALTGAIERYVNRQPSQPADETRILAGVVQKVLNEQRRAHRLLVDGAIRWTPPGDTAKDLLTYLDENYLPSLGLHGSASTRPYEALRRAAGPGTELLVRLQRAVAYDRGVRNTR